MSTREPILDDGNWTVETTEEAHALFDITGIEPGDYYITAAHPEYATRTIEVHLDSTPRELTIALERAGPPQRRPRRSWTGTIEALEDLITALEALKGHLGERK